MPEFFSIDISENKIMEYGEALLNMLLIDRTTNCNIIWATSDYEDLGEKYVAQSPITYDLITGAGRNVIQPRIYKEKISKTSRTKEKAEVFTPSWICNEQNNLIDKSWFGREDVFNIQSGKTWIATDDKIEFNDASGQSWRDYVKAKRLEITCGEAPYLVSRYDTVTGCPIKIKDRIGLLDRKLRVVNENTEDETEWMKWVKIAFQSIYGFEFQGDNLLLARENLLFTFIDYVNFQLKREPTIEELESIAYIISWNLWQMDGMHFTVPFGSAPENKFQTTISDDSKKEHLYHYYCKIRDWQSEETITYISLVQNKGERII